MRITLKLFAHLSAHLPASARGQIATVEVPEGATAAEVIALFGVPPEECHLVLVDGVFLREERRATLRLEAGQSLAIWPMVAGG